MTDRGWTNWIEDAANEGISLTRAERIAAGRCTYRDCERPAAKGHTTCTRHYSAGRSMAQERMAQRARAREEK